MRRKPPTITPDSTDLEQVTRAVQALQGLRIAQLKERFLALFDTPTRSNNAAFLRKKLAWRIQELAEGGLTPETLTRLEALLPKALPGPRAPKVSPPCPAPKPPKPPCKRDPRLPAPGTVITREHGGILHEVQVLEAGFLWQGRSYASLSAIARAITGTTWNGYLFFGLSVRS